MINRVYNEELIIASNQRFKEKKYWFDKLSGELTLASYKYDKEQMNVLNRKMESVSFVLSKDISHKLVDICNNSDQNLLALLITTINILLNKHTGNSDIILGTPIFKQESGSIYINTMLPLRMLIDENVSFKQLLIQTKGAITEAIHNQNFPFEVLVNELGVRNSNGLPSLFDVIVLLENIQDKNYIEHTNANVVFSFTKDDETIEAKILFNSNLYNNATILSIQEHFCSLLESVLNNTDISILDTVILSEKEMEQVICQFNNTDSYFESNMVITHVFENRVKENPNLTSLIFNDQEISYSEFNQRVNYLAKLLREKGVGRNEIVGIMVERSIEMMVGIFGILKAGGAYMPIDPDCPEERLQYMLSDSNSRYLLTNSSFEKNNIFNVETIQLDKIKIDNYTNYDVEIINKPQDLAYVIYTSGSTGRPKGVLIEHAGLMNRLTWMSKECNIDNSDIILQKTRYTFDVSVWEIFLPAFLGAKLCLCPHGKERDPLYLYDLMKRQNITTVHFVPSALAVFLNSFIETIQINSLKKCICSGEALNTTIKNMFFEKIDNVELYNLYGPTEATVDVTLYKVNREDSLIPIGKPVANTKLYILDKVGRPTAIGVPGELYISGVQLARGYLNKENLTQQTFVNNPFEEDKKMYKTGDLARWLPDGNIDFLGRIDSQVKLRGFRIDLSEIENQMIRIDGIKQVIAIVRNQGMHKTEESRLFAYILTEKGFTISEIREALSQNLPEYMIPSQFFKIEEIPLTPNGKIDRNALEQMGVALENNSEFVEPKTNIEKELVNLFKSGLNIESISTNDRFFEIGLTSFDIVKMSNLINNNLNIKINIDTLFKYSTIKRLAEFLEQNEDYEEPLVTRSEAINKGKADRMNRLRKRKGMV